MPERRKSMLDNMGEWFRRNQDAVLTTVGILALTEGTHLTNIIPDAVDPARGLVELFGEDAIIADPVIDFWGGSNDSLGFEVNNPFGVAVSGTDGTFLNPDLMSSMKTKEDAGSLVNMSEDEVTKFKDSLYDVVNNEKNYLDADGKTDTSAMYKDMKALVNVTSEASLGTVIADLDVDSVANLIKLGNIEVMKDLDVFKGFDDTEDSLNKFLGALKDKGLIKNPESFKEGLVMTDADDREEVVRKVIDKLDGEDKEAE